MKMIMLWGALFITSSQAFAACQDMVRVNWRMLPDESKIQTLDSQTNVEKFCNPLTEDPDSNILLTLTDGKKKFQRKVFVPMFRYWDKQTPDGKLTGGAQKAKEIFFESLVPTWAKKAQIEVSDLASGKVIAKGKP